MPMLLVTKGPINAAQFVNFQYLWFGWSYMNNLAKLVENVDSDCGICLDSLDVGVRPPQVPFYLTFHYFRQWLLHESGSRRTDKWKQSSSSVTNTLCKCFYGKQDMCRGH